MTPTDKPGFVAVLVGLAAVKPGKGLTPEALEIWWNAMQRWELADFREAASHLARSVEFMPSPYDFEQLRRAGRRTSQEAWSEVLEFVRKGFHRFKDDWGLSITDRTQGRKLDDRIERAVHCLGGYKAIAMCDEDKLHFLGRQFNEAYDAMQDADEVRASVPQLAGPNWLDASAIKRISNGG